MKTTTAYINKNEHCTPSKNPNHYRQNYLGVTVRRCGCRDGDDLAYFDKLSEEGEFMGSVGPFATLDIAEAHRLGVASI